MNDQWCILRMAGPRTLAVAESLKQAGYDAWTPVGFSSKRKSRNPAKERALVPVMPTYVFARASHLLDLMAEVRRPSSAHPAFSVFRWHDRVPLIADCSLDFLRRAERRQRPPKAEREFTKGEMVRIEDGGFAGMSGIVETGKGQYTMVCFPGFNVPIKVSTLLLLAGDGEREAA